MRISLRWFGAGLVGVAVFLASASRQSTGQQPDAKSPAAPAPNVFTPQPPRGQFPTAVLGKNAPNAAPNAGLGYTGLAPGSTAEPGYNTLSATYANSPQGYASLTNSNGGGYGQNYGGSGMAGYGMWGTQWMMNPYQGYLSGAASITDANAQYQLTIQQARMVREHAIQEHYRTRRAMMEQAEWEMAHRPDPEKIRQAALERELDRARHDPPSTEIWSGRSLNSLLRTLINRQGQGLRGPDVPLNEDTLKSVNLTAGNTRGNIGLLKGNGDPQWPKPLRGEAFKDAREALNRHLKQAANTVQLNRAPNASTLHDLQTDLKKLQNLLDANTGAMSEDQYVEARRHLRLLSNTIAALKDPNISNYLNGNWTPRGKNVAELVQFMRETGLWFAPATPGDEAAYTALHHALAAFDAGMPRAGRVSSKGDAEK